MTRITALLLALLLVPQISLAQIRDVSASIWTVTGNQVMVRYTFPRELSARLASPGKPSPSIEAIGRYVLSKIGVRRQGAPCAAVDQGYDLGSIDTLYAGPELYSFEILFRCPQAPGPLVVRNDAFFDQSVDHIDVASIRVDDSPAAARLMTGANTTVSMTMGRAPDPTGLSTYMGLGLTHTLARVVGVGAALGLALLIRGRRDIRLLIGGLLLGYLAAAAAAGIGGWIMQPQPGQAFDGFLLLFMGALLAVQRSGRRGSAAVGLAIVVLVATAILVLLRHGDAALCLAAAAVFGAATLYAGREPTVARWNLLIPSMLVGAVDGFWLASTFAPLHAIVSIGGVQLIACNLGALLGILLVISIAAGVRRLARHFARPLRAPILSDLLAASLSGVGVFAMLTL